MVWREELESIQDVGAFRPIERNLGEDDASAEPAQGVEITPSSFRMVRVRALLGRTLIDADEQTGAPPVIVLGYDLWRSRFSGDPGLVGRTVQLGGSASTVVGIMPEGFAFPVNHQFWVLLRPDALLAYERRQGPAIQIFGRLASNVTLEEAQAELTALGLNAAADFPSTHEHLRPRVMRYTELFIGGGGNGLVAYLMESIFVMLLLLLSANVATMVFARTATREHEIGMRFALGARRGQIIAQLFVEALVLALTGAVAGLAIVAWGTGWVTRRFWEILGGQAPFWLDGDLNFTTVLYAAALAVLCAVVAGVLPALKATGSGLQSRLRHAPGGGGFALRFGGLWSGMIVVQVAFAVLVVPPAIVATRGLLRAGYADPGFMAEEYLSARLEMELEQPPADSAASAAFFSEFQATYRELQRRLLADPQISRVTFASRVPGMDHVQPRIDVDGGESVPGGATEQRVNTTSVDVDFFDALGAEIVAGRGFDSGDVGFYPGVVVVNEIFVQRILNGRNAIGRRVRYTTRSGQRGATGRPQDVTGPFELEPGPWYEIVGVVSNLGMSTRKGPFASGQAAGMYHPLQREALGSGGSFSVRMAFHVRGDAASFAPELRKVAHAVDPDLRLYDVLALGGAVDQSTRNHEFLNKFFSSVTSLLTLIAILISTAGTYSLMSFTVSRRTREIAIMAALGADRRRVITVVFSRAMAQIGTGILVGGSISVYVFARVFGPQPIGLRLFLMTAAVLMLVGLVACAVPMRRALRIEATEALKEVG